MTLGNELGRGGEGAVFDVVGQPDAVAKIYLKPPSAQHAAKLSAMAGMATPPLLKIAAWPTGTLRDPSGTVVGFTMPKVGGHEPVFKLYGPKLRMQQFPTADWRFLIHAAANAARSFSTVHAAGLVIGDVNHGNLVVGQDATVRMIDCDSFQVTRGGKTWFCEVGVGTHQPPEMQGRSSFAGVVRTPNQDSFGLAVIIFQLLCIARHPFAGRYKGAGEPPSIEDAIQASRYAYSRNRSRTAMEPPPGSLPIDALTPTIQDLFEKAFDPGSVRGGRPDANRWVTALGELASDLRVCGANGGHYYRKGLSACPWCAIENASGITLFPVVFRPGASVGATGMAALWQEVSKVPDPPPVGQCPPPPGAALTPSPPAQALAGVGGSLKTAAWASVGASVLATLIIAPPDLRALMVPAIGVIVFVIHRNGGAALQNPFRQRLVEVKRDWETLQRAWSAPVPGPTVAEIRAGLQRIKAQHDVLPDERARRLQKLNEQRRQKQLEDHLDRFSLANAKIPGIGPTRVATLASHGIDTASDIIRHRLLAVPGFGPATVSKLLAWRQSHEMTFRFDPNRGVSPSEIAVVERDIATQRTKLEREVAAGLTRLRAAVAAHTARRQALEGRAAELLPQFAQALADAAVVPEDRTTHKRLLAMSGAAAALAVVTGIGGPSSSPGHNPPPVATSRPAAPMAMPSPPPPPPPPAQQIQTARPAPVERSPQMAEPARPVQPWRTEPVEAPPLVPGPSLPPVLNPASAASGPGDVEHVTMRQAANVRSAANGNSAVVRTAPSGVRLRVFARAGGWVQVGEGEPWGWVYSGLVDAIP
ncbi:SH3 domain-containing protein [Belnapia rosea]|uniref:SH3 domain-containing protein n=1 Tax=Belnapia rosea TaxID=938405 RepID=UPI00088663E8|nr:SH3 domain-containing protein [Belnapia rosea]SDB22016.1 protein kinase and helix-hairpin-helix DNA-binding domain-containing protein [Belnapia rosea]